MVSPAHTRLPQRRTLSSQDPLRFDPPLATGSNSLALSASPTRSSNLIRLSAAPPPEPPLSSSPLPDTPIDPRFSLRLASPHSFPVPRYLAHSSHRSYLFTHPFSPDFCPPHSLDSPDPARPPSPLTAFHLPLASTLGVGFALQAPSSSTATSTSRPRPSTSPMAVALPTGWDPKDCSDLLHVDSDSRGVRFVGSSRDTDAAAVRANNPMPKQAGVYYYELEVLDKGQLGHISIGFSILNVDLTRLPGWERSSYGYHGDDGLAFSSQAKGKEYGPKFTTGDVIGCGIDWTTGAGRGFFTKNGLFLGYIFENLDSYDHLYPSVGLKTQGESVRANFGQEPFKFDIQSFVRDRKINILTEIENQNVPDNYISTSDLPSDLPTLPKLPTGKEKPSVTFHDFANSSTPDATILDSRKSNKDSSPSADKEFETDPDPDGMFAIKEIAKGMIKDWLEFHGYSETAKSFERHCNSDVKNLQSFKRRSIKIPTTDFSMLGNSLLLKSNKSSCSRLSSSEDDAEMFVDASETEATGAANEYNQSESDSLLLHPPGGSSTNVLKLISANERNEMDMEMKRREYLRQCILSGKIDEVIATIEQFYPSLAAHETNQHETNQHETNQHETNQHLAKEEPSDSLPNNSNDIDSSSSSLSHSETLADTMMVLRCRKFVELILAYINASSSSKSASNGADDDSMASDDGERLENKNKNTHSDSESLFEQALAYGRELQARYDADPRPHVQRTLCDAWGLFAHDNPSVVGGEIAWLASSDAREELASRLNSAILASQGKATRPALEVAYRHGKSMLEELWRLGSGKAALVTMEDVVG